MSNLDDLPPNPSSASWNPKTLGRTRLAAALIVDAAALPLIVLAAPVLRTYGFGLFVVLPFALGVATPIVLGWHAPRKFREGVEAALLALAILALGLLVFAIEGLICILMASPIAAAITVAGVAVGHGLQRQPPRTSAALLAVMVSMAPVMMGAERVMEPDPPLWRVESTLSIDAAPEIVWRHVVSFGELPPPHEWLFRGGVAYPLRAEISGTGVGAIRRCVFSTGSFVEPITVWDENRRLAFSVASQPASMTELSPWPEIHPPHLDGFLVSERGEFRLERLDDGRTRLVGTTWYRHRLAPAFYWRLWSDGIIHRIHLRVLEQIRVRSELDAKSATS